LIPGSVWLRAVLLQAAYINDADAVDWVPEVRREAVSTAVDAHASAVDWIPLLVF